MPGECLLLIQRQPHSQSELRIVFKQRVGPGRAATFRSAGPRRRRQISAVDRRASGRIGDDGPLAEQLAHQLQVGRLAAAGTGTGVLEQRLQQLRAFDLNVRDLRAVHFGQVAEVLEVGPFLSEMFVLGAHVDRFELRGILSSRRADVDAHTAAGAVVGGDLNRHQPAGQILAGPLARLEAVRFAVEGFGGIGLGANRRVRAGECAQSALDADVGVPDRDLAGDAPLLELCCGGGKGAVDRQGTDRQQISLPFQHHAGHALDEVRCRLTDRRNDTQRGGRFGRNGNLVQVLQCRIDRGTVPLHDDFAALRVGLVDGPFDLIDRFLAGEHVDQGEEAGLHDGVDPASQSGFAGDAVAVYDVELQLLRDDLFLHFAGQVIPDLVRSVGTVQQKRRAGGRDRQHIPRGDELELMAPDEVRPPDEVRRLDRFAAESQVRDRL